MFQNKCSVNEFHCRRKIPLQYESPIDQLLYYPSCIISKYLYWLLKKTNKDTYVKNGANILTTISLILSLIGLYYIYIQKYTLGASLYFIGYLFDCCDGLYARTFNVSTQFGDHYDHISDIIKILGFYIILLTSSISKKNKIIFILINIITVPLGLWSFGCQQKLAKDNDSESYILDKLKGLCSNSNNIYYSRYFSSGSWQIIQFIFLIYLNYNKK